MDTTQAKCAAAGESARNGLQESKSCATKSVRYLFLVALVFFLSLFLAMKAREANSLQKTRRRKKVRALALNVSFGFARVSVQVASDHSGRQFMCFLAFVFEAIFLLLN